MHVIFTLDREWEIAKPKWEELIIRYNTIYTKRKNRQERVVENSEDIALGKTLTFQ